MAVKGLTPQSALLFQLIRELDSAPGVYDATADRYLMPSLRVDLQPDTAYDKFKPMGWSARAWNLVTCLHSVLSGAVKLDFEQAPVLLEMLCGPPVSQGFPTGQWTRVYQLTQSGRQPRSVFTSEFGTKSAASRMPYTLLQALALNWVRMTDSNEGSVTLLARKPTSDNVALTGSVSQNTIFTATAAAVVASGTLSLFDTDGAPTGAVTITPGMTGSALKAAIEALDFYNTVSVTGSTTATTGVDLTSHATPLSGSGNAFDGNSGTVARSPVAWDMGSIRGISEVDFSTNGTGAYTIRFEESDTADFAVFDELSNDVTAGGFSGPYSLAGPSTKRYLRLRFDPTDEGDGVIDVTMLGSTYSGTYTVTVTDPGNTPIAAPTIAGTGWTTARTQLGGSANIVLPSLVPISPQMWTARRASAYSDLAAASPISRIAGFTMDFPDRTNLFWFLDENDIDFDDFVDGEGEVSTKLTLVNDVDGAVADLVAKSEQMPGLAEWWRFLANHPGGLHSLQIDGLFGVEGNIPYSNNNNARFREFPLSAMLNDQGWLLQFTLTVAV